MLSKEERKAIAERIVEEFDYTEKIMRGEYNNLTYYPSEITHKSPVTAQELSDYMQAVINEYGSDINNGVMELSEQGMNTLKYRVYDDIVRSRNE